ncbi:MAG: glycosyltransferase family 2 protein [Candidatus Daviesbacteria bacterium]|nr:glycosyltransferase family 2 protein [Candidatus Daviesbacteria bacterium]
MKLSIIVPIYNEEKTIQEVLQRIANIDLAAIKKEIIIVDDGSTDSSKFKVQSSKLFKKIKFIAHQKNLGKGAAIRTGIAHSTGDLVIIQDADLEYDPSYYMPLLRPIMQNKASVVYGTRLLTYPLRLWGKNKTVLPVHLIANKFLTLLTNILYRSRLTDMETGYKVFKSEVLKSINIDSNRFDFEAEITVKLLKKKVPITEVPISVKPRTYKEGKKIGLIDGFIAIWTLIKYRF